MRIDSESLFVIQMSRIGYLSLFLFFFFTRLYIEIHSERVKFLHPYTYFKIKWDSYWLPIAFMPRFESISPAACNRCVTVCLPPTPLSLSLVLPHRFRSKCHSKCWQFNFLSDGVSVLPVDIRTTTYKYASLVWRYIINELWYNISNRCVGHKMSWTSKLFLLIKNCDTTCIQSKNPRFVWVQSSKLSSLSSQLAQFRSLFIFSY